LWHDAGFYNALEERHGAVFVWSMYMPFAGPQYIQLAPQAAGVPTLTLEADMVDAHGWSHEHTTDRLSRFLEASGLG
jgi:hypothetical protein